MSNKKISQIDAIRQTSMFIIDKNIEEKYAKMVRTGIAEYKKSMLNIANEDGLKDFIKSDKDSIKKLITVLGISGERFKRVVSMIRVIKGYTFESEWTEQALQKELVKKPQLLDEFCELFMSGRNLEKYQKLIPEYILDDFCIDADIRARICNDDFLGKLIKSSFSPGYNKDYSIAYAMLVDDKLKSLSKKYGLRYESRPLGDISKEPLHLIGDTEKYIIVNYQFNITTSKQQTTYAKQIAGLKSICRGNDKIIVVNILDGAGWIARSSDYKRVYNNCDYFFTLKTLDKLEDIIQNFFNI